MTIKDKCLNQGFCDDCWCKVPDMLWVKDCKGKCNTKSND